MRRLAVAAVGLALIVGIPAAWTQVRKTAPVEEKDCALVGANYFWQKLAPQGFVTCAPGILLANPTAQVGPTVINGVATTAMRSDAAPKLADTTVTPGTYGPTPSITVDQQGRLTAASNVTTGVGAITGLANPTATAGPTAINGSATTAMRSDAAPAVQLGTAAQKGIVQVDGTTITASGGVISATAAASGGVTGLANPTATASDVAVNGSATTAMRSDAAPAVQKASNSQFGVVEVDGTTITATGGVISSAAGTTFANPTASVGPSAVNGSATTAMRSDAAPALANTAVTPGSYTYSSLTVDAQGRLTAASSGTTPASTGYAAAGWVAGANPNGAPIFTAVTATTITGAYIRVETPVGATAAISILKAPGGTACSSGTNILAGIFTFNANNTAASSTTLSVGVGAAVALAAGDTACISTANGANFLVGNGVGGVTLSYTIP